MSHTAPGSLVASLILSALALPCLAADVSTSPGRSAVFETRHLDNAPTSANDLTAQIKKGKKRHVLTVTATAATHISPASQQYLLASLTVNGFAVPKSVTRYCDVESDCSVTGVWILDLDQAELDHPGVYVKQPLDIDLLLQDGYANVAETLDMTLVARMEKKK